MRHHLLATAYKPLCAAFLLLALLLSACTRPPNDSPSEDPFEKINRPIYMLNAGLDTYLLRPLAVGYEFITPQFFRTGVSNFFDNLTYPVTMVNSFLQGKLLQGTQDTGRFLLNSTVGLAGVLDPASAVGLRYNDEDFGQTFSVWGIPQGPYLVLPLLGPSTVTSGIGLLPDSLVNPLLQWPSSSVRSKLVIGWTIESRQTLLAIDAAVRESFDPYLFIRESYLQNRRFLIHDGNLPDGGFDDEFNSDFDDLEFTEPMPDASAE
jgi:phospholipid-binding lipoprotein MlaA